MHDVQVDETDTAGKPIAAADVLFNDLDNLEAGYGDVPVDDGVGRVALPAGTTWATSLVFDFDSSGNFTAIHWITDDTVTVPATGTAPTVKLSEAAATSEITVSTPRPTGRGLSVTLYDSDGAGHFSAPASSDSPPRPMSTRWRSRRSAGCGCSALVERGGPV